VGLGYKDPVPNVLGSAHIFAAHALIEEMLELVIAEAIPHTECLEVLSLTFWQKVKLAFSKNWLAS
jgi:hypothetical protein